MSERALYVCSELSHTHLCSDPLHGEGLWGREAQPGPQLSSQDRGIIVQGLLCGLNPPLFLKQFSLIEMRFMRHDPHPSQVCSRGSEFIGDMCNFCLTPVTPPGLICPFSNALSM